MNAFFSGTVFTSKKLEGDKKNVPRKFATVFAKRVAEASVPRKCKICECTADDTGVSYMECYHCGYPTAVTYDYVRVAPSLFYYDTLLFITYPRSLSTARAAFCNPSVQQMVLLRVDCQLLARCYFFCSTPSLI